MFVILEKISDGFIIQCIEKPTPIFIKPTTPQPTDDPTNGEVIDPSTNTFLIYFSY